MLKLSNFYAAWVGILLGFVSGSVLGLFFHDRDWLGGYGSWSRRMVRLGHISFFCIAIINLIYALSVQVFNVQVASPYPSYLFVVGAVTCPLSAFCQPGKGFSDTSSLFPFSA